MNQRIKELANEAGLLGPSSRVGNSHQATEKFAELIFKECRAALHPMLDEVLRNSMRYEALRRLNPKQFSELCEKNIGDGIPFDDLVDKLIGEKK